mmetsp:Transcript_15441/g.33194  ORF Transcript_15441/g.33194 Transcript_15441/m.33194 type:complete len:192 (-) Transcript_15441:1533-2108(-)
MTGEPDTVENGSAAEAAAEAGNASSSSQQNQKPEKFFQLFTGMRRDLAARLPHYKSDWSKPRSVFTVINAIFFAFVVQLIPALIFAELMDKQTKGNLAAAETLLSAGIIGIIYALISGQPLTLLGITGPVAILLGTSYGLAEQFDSDYWPFFLVVVYMDGHIAFRDGHYGHSQFRVAYQSVYDADIRVLHC